MSSTGISPVFPLLIDDGDHTVGYKVLDLTRIEDMGELFRFHIKNIVLTNPGERIWDSEFGVGLSNYLFELNTNSQLEDIRSRIIQQLDTYAPYINLTELTILTPEDSQAINIIMKYFVPLQGQINSVQDVFNFTLDEFTTFTVNSQGLTSGLSHPIIGNPLLGTP